MEDDMVEDVPDCARPGLALGVHVLDHRVEVGRLEVVEIILPAASHFVEAHAQARTVIRAGGQDSQTEATSAPQTGCATVSVP
jgi:hypothetical protein